MAKADNNLYVTILLVHWRLKGFLPDWLMIHQRVAQHLFTIFSDTQFKRVSIGGDLFIETKQIIKPIPRKLLHSKTKDET